MLSKRSLFTQINEKWLKTLCYALGHYSLYKTCGSIQHFHKFAFCSLQGDDKSIVLKNLLFWNTWTQKRHCCVNERPKILNPLNISVWCIYKKGFPATCGHSLLCKHVCKAGPLINIHTVSKLSADGEKHTQLHKHLQCTVPNNNKLAVLKEEGGCHTSWERKHYRQCTAPPKTLTNTHCHKKHEWEDYKYSHNENTEKEHRYCPLSQINTNTHTHRAGGSHFHHSGQEEMWFTNDEKLKQRGGWRTQL